MFTWKAKLVWSLACLLSASLTHRYQQHRAKRLIKAFGTVLDIETDSDGVHTPVISFTSRDGQVVTFQGQFGTNVTRPRQGSRVTVLYDPTDPEAAQVEGGQHFLLIFFGVVALIPWLDSS